MMLVWVSLSYATFGVILKKGRVHDAAPIAHWMKGKYWGTVKAWVERKGGVYEFIMEED